MNARIFLFIALGLIANVSAATLQQRIDSASPGQIVRIEAGIHAGPVVINKPLTLIGENGAEIRGNGFGSVVTIPADDARSAISGPFAAVW